MQYVGVVAVHLVPVCIITATFPRKLEHNVSIWWQQMNEVQNTIFYSIPYDDYELT